jgi:uncharacterized membrane protein YfcA
MRESKESGLSRPEELPGKLMEEIWKYALLLGIGIVAGVINVMAGGGSTLTLPALIFLGMDGSVANGTNRVAIFIQSIVATSAFRKENIKGLIPGLKMGLFAFPGAITGAIIATNISGRTFEIVLAVIMIFIVIQMLWPKKKKLAENEQVETGWKIFTAMFFIGFYGGFIQVGVGFLLMASLYNILNLKLVYVNMYKVLITALFTIPALLVFILADKVLWLPGLVLAAGTSLGAWFAAKISVRKGDKVVKYVLAASIVIIAIKLTGAF